MADEIPFIRYVARKLTVSAKDVARFLDIDKRTLYNYANYRDEQLPNIVKEKFVSFFLSHEGFSERIHTVSDIPELLEECDPLILHRLRAEFLLTSLSMTRDEKKKENNALEKRNDNGLMAELLKDFDLEAEYKHLSKGYLYSLFEIVFAKLDKENDYRFLEYINNYKKDRND